MQYSNFIMKNNVHATLSTAVSSVATTIQLTTGQGARFGTEFPQIATLESFDGDGKVVKREIVQITARNDDDLTVVRAFAPCPANDDANSQSQTSVSFSADDQISLYIPKEIFDVIKRTLNDIYDNGTNNLRTESVSGLDVEVNAGPVLVGTAYYDFAGGTITLTDNATNYLEIDEDGNLANNTTGRNDENTKLAIITTANGSVINIKDRRLGTVGGKISGINIHELTEKENISPNDELVVSDSENIWNNKKAKVENIYGKAIGICGMDISNGDIVSLTDLSESQNGKTLIGNTISSVAIKVYGNGESSDKLSAYLGIVGTGQDITVRIETDDNGKPSGTLVHNDATTTVSKSDLSTTVALFEMTFGSQIELTKDQRYWIVFSCATLDTDNYSFVGNGTNYGVENVVQYDGNDWTKYAYIENCNINYGTATGGSVISSYSYNLTPNTDFIIKTLTGGRVNTIEITQNGDTIYQGAIGTGLNIPLKAGITYNIKVDCAGLNERRGGGFPTTNSQYFTLSSDGSSIFPQWANSSRTLDLEVKANSYIKATNIEMTLICASSSNMNTISDEMGIATEDQTEGNILKYATKGGIVTNNSRDLIPGQSYMFNGGMTLSSGLTATSNYIFMGVALTKTKLKVDLKVHFRIQDTTQRTMTFSGIVTSSNGGNIKINGGANTIEYGLPILKGRTISLTNATYWFYIDKGR